MQSKKTLITLILTLSAALAAVDCKKAPAGEDPAELAEEQQAETVEPGDSTGAKKKKKPVAKKSSGAAATAAEETNEAESQPAPEPTAQPAQPAETTAQPTTPEYDYSATPSQSEPQMKKNKPKLDF